MRIRHEAKLSASNSARITKKKKRRDKLVIPEQLILTGRDLSHNVFGSANFFTTKL